MKRALSLVIFLSLLVASPAVASVEALDVSAGWNYDGYISNAESAHAFLYTPPGDWGLSNRMVSTVFGQHSSSTSAGRNYAWQFQVTGGTGLPDSGQIITAYGLFQLSTDLDAEPPGGYVQPPKGTNPNGLLPLQSNVLRAYRPHSGQTGWPSATASVVLPVGQQTYYSSINFLVSGSNGKTLLYADYDDGQGGSERVLIYETPGVPKTTSETGFPDILSSSSSNPDVVEVTDYRMTHYWGQASDYSLVRSGTTRLWTFADPIELDPSRKLKGFAVAIYDQDTWKSRMAVVYAASADTCQPVYHIDAINGDDDTGDGSSAHPWQTLGRVRPLLDGGETVVLHDGNYGTIEEAQSSASNVFADWVTYKAAPGCDPELEHVYFGKYASQWLPVDLHGNYDAYVRFEGLHIKDGFRAYGARHWALVDCLVERYGPWTGSVENIEKTAITFRCGDDILIQGCEVTNTGTGLAGAGHGISIIGNYLHDGCHDGLRVTGFWDALVEGNTICRFDDGVTDQEEPTWSRHCDLIHIFVPGPQTPGWQNHNVMFRNNVLYDAESQVVQFNNYGTVHNELITFENNVFGPGNAPMFNNAEPCHGLIFRNNSVVYFAGGRQFHRWLCSNYTLRIVYSSTDVEVYNNILGSSGIETGADVHIFDWNLIQLPGSPQGVDGSRAYGRFTQIGGDPLYVQPDAFDGALQATSPAINAGTRLFAPSAVWEWDIEGTPRDNRPDLGAWEMPGLTPDPESEPPVYQDTKTIFVDDFEDGHYCDVDPWLQAPNQQGLSWHRPDPVNFKFYVTNSTSYLNRNSLHCPTGATGQQRIAWLFSDQGEDWADYDFQFDAHNSYLVIGSGVLVLAQDTQNCYWLDISRDNGRLVRIMNGVSTELARDADIELPHLGALHYKVMVRHVTQGIEISVDVGANGSIEFSYTDTDATAIQTFTAGGVGFHDDTDAVYHKVKYDNIRVDVVEFAEP